MDILVLLLLQDGYTRIIITAKRLYWYYHYCKMVILVLLLMQNGYTSITILQNGYTSINISAKWLY